MLPDSSRDRWSWVLGVVALSVVLGGCGGGGGSPDNRPMLEKLGVPTDAPPRADAQTVHPLQRLNSVYQKKSELYLSGLTMTDSTFFTGGTAAFNGKNQLLLDDGSAGYAPLFSATDEGWTDYNATSTAADLNGDGHDEVVVLYQNRTNVSSMPLSVRIIRRTTAGFEQTDPQQIGDVPFDLTNDGVTLSMGTFNHLQIASGDLDGDGRDEVVVAAGGTLLVLKWDPLTDAFTVLDTKVYSNANLLAGQQITTLAVGNVDGDPAVELVVVNGVRLPTRAAKYYVYDLSGGHLTLKAGGDDSELMQAARIRSFDYTDAPGGRPYAFARVAIGDLDGDGRNEIVYAGDVTDDRLSVTVAHLDKIDTQWALVRDTTSEFMNPMAWGVQFVPVLAVFDADGDRKKDLLAYRFILHLKDGALVHKWAPDGVTAWTETEVPFALPYPYWDKVTVGDFSGDGREDVAFVTHPIYGTQLVVWGYDLNTGAFQELRRIDVDRAGHRTTLCAANVDDDSIVLQYTGEYALRYSTPQILAVLASPPYYAGQDASDANTALEWEAGSEDETGNTYGFYLGASFGYSEETPFWGSAGSSKLTVDLDISQDWNYSTGHDQSSARSFTCGAGENQVIFVSTPMDVYSYKIIDSPDPAQKDKVFTVEIPRTPVIMPMNVDLFNASVDEPYRVPAGILGHTMGDPWSYPTRAEMKARFQHSGGDAVTYGGTQYSEVIPVSSSGGFRTPDPFRVTTGYTDTGSQQITLASGTSHGYGSEFNLQVGVEFENVAGGVLVGGKAGFHYGYSHSYTTTQRTTVSGTIPNIPRSMSAKPVYTAGLFAYPYASTTAGAPRFIVVNYWVESP